MDYQTIHRNISRRVRDILPSHIARLDWSREKIDAFRLKQLRVLLQHVTSHSPYYQRLFQNYDIESMTLETLSQIPPLTKKEVLKHWDEIICVPEITKAKAEAHLQALRDNPKANPFFKDKYYITATGGSSGLRGLYVWDLNYFADITAVDFRHQVRDDLVKSGFIPRKVAVLTAPSPIHASTPLCTTRLHYHDTIEHLPVNLPLQELCARLNVLQPTQLIGYASVITRLAKEALHGNLSIRPKRITTNSEPLNDAARKTIFEAFGVEANNTWGSVEMGIAGIEDDRHQGLILSEDMILFEPVDEDLKSVQHAKDAKKIMITNLFNKTLPLIRYVVDDVIEVQEAPFTAYHVIPNIAGRTDDWFSYPNQVEIHPMVFWNVFELEGTISEYQVQQTEDGAKIYIIPYDSFDAESVKKRLKKDLIEAGLTHPKLNIEQVKHIKRHEETAKLRRFVPLSS